MRCWAATIEAQIVAPEENRVISCHRRRTMIRLRQSAWEWKRSQREGLPLMAGRRS
jgi:hypothetical protein